MNEQRELGGTGDNEADELCPRCTIEVDKILLYDTSQAHKRDQAKVKTTKHYAAKFDIQNLSPECQFCGFLNSMEAFKNTREKVVYWYLALDSRENRPTNWHESARPYSKDFGNIWAVSNYWDERRDLRNYSQKWDYGLCTFVNINETLAEQKHGFSQRQSPQQKNLANIEALRKWLKTCEDQHESTCATTKFVWSRDFSVIDCIENRSCRLPEAGKYIALSYVWGSPTLSNAQEKSVHHVMDYRTKSPLVVQDAIAVTLRLGFRYLWVDRYCISSDSVMKHEQILNMDSVYESAYATLFAVAGEDSSFGLPGVSTRQRGGPARLEVKGKTFTLCPPCSRPVIEKSVWDSRAWTYQEYLFSRRRIFFTPTQIYFECSCMARHESLHGTGRSNVTGIFTHAIVHLRDSERRLKSGTLDLNFKNPWLSNVWWGAIGEYSRRSMSYDSDILNGMLGVFRALQRGKNPVHHHWGIPYRVTSDGQLENPMASFCWHSARPGLRREGFPTWSWTGWLDGGKIEPVDVSRQHSTFVVDPHCKIGVEGLDGTESWKWPTDPRTHSAMSQILVIDTWTIRFKYNYITETCYINSEPSRRCNHPDPIRIHMQPVLGGAMNIIVLSKRRLGVEIELMESEYTALALGFSTYMGDTKLTFLVVEENGGKETAVRVGYMVLEGSVFQAYDIIKIVRRVRIG